MPRLILVISDLYPSRQRVSGMPRLVGLERWLARGRCEHLSQGWQQWLLDAYLKDSEARQPWAEVAGAGAGVDGRRGWLATPVNLVAGIDTVRVHPAGLLHLELQQQQALAADFAVVFRDSGWTLHATGRRELLLTGTAALCARSSDPARWLGADPAPGAVSGADAAAADARTLRRLGSELEMWLHEHPVNRARSAAGKLAASGLWLWGGAAPPLPATGSAAPVGAARLKVYGADLFLEGLCRLTGGSSHALPTLPTPPALPDPVAADAIVHLTLGGAPDSAALQALERELIAPLMRQLRHGYWDALTLLAGEQGVTLRRAGWRRWTLLARKQPWWERLLG